VSVLVVGLNHRSAPLEVLESLSVPEASMPKALHDLAGRPGLSEAVVLSTCQRLEVYAVAGRYHAAVSEIRNFMAEWSGLAPEEFTSYCYEFHEVSAVAHLFKVAAGLDSALIGETEILGQVGGAWEAARDEGVTGPVLSILFRHALEAGKRVRTETAIARGTTSLSQAAVHLARESLGSLRGRRAVVVGAGSMGQAVCSALSSCEVASVTVLNRTLSRAEALAERHGGKALPLGELGPALAQADVAFFATASAGTILSPAELAGSDERRLVVVDLALPRDVHPGVGSVPGVELLDIDALSAHAEAAMRSRRAELPAANLILAEEIQRYEERAAERHVAPLVAAIHERAEEVRQAELRRFASKLAGLDEASYKTVEALTAQIVAKLLHEPTVKLKAAAGSPTGEALAEAARQLFEL